MCKLHGVRLIKGIKIFQSMFKNQNLPLLLTKKLDEIFQHQLIWSGTITQTDISVP